MSDTPLFQRRAEPTLKLAQDTFRTRGDQYGDTWADCQWLKLKAILFTMWGKIPTPGQCRAMALAAYADMKYQRMQGGYAEDHILDGINYDAALATEMREIYASAGTPQHTLD